jgi:putative transposase
MKIKRKFSGEQKAQIVLSILKKEKSLLEVSKNQNLSPSLLHKWRDQLLVKAHTIFENNGVTNETEKKLKHYEYVISKLTTQNDFLEKVLAVTK